jgi:hypothetical protein
MALEHARVAKIFGNESSDWVIGIGQPPVVVNATGNDLSNLIKWRSQLAQDVQAQNSVPEFVEAPESVHSPPDVVPLAAVDEAQVTTLPASAYPEMALTAAQVSELKADQLRAYEIIIWHLDATLAGREPPPLRMLLHGEGGTGKSKVIQTVTQAFIERAVSHWLLKSAYTGIACSVIDGKTTHVIGGISVKGDQLSDEGKAKLQRFWRHYRYLILDEVSMLGKSFLARLSRNISIGKGGLSTQSFGGINVIICGDFHQFPPVAVRPSEALF